MLRSGTVSTNAFLRKVHNFAVDMNWLPATVIPRRQWPAIHYKEKRAITLEEHQRIIAAEVNPERKMLYQLCWHLGASQGDIASLKGEDVDWTNGTVSFTRKKTGVPVLVHLGGEASNLLKLEFGPRLDKCPVKFLFFLLLSSYMTSISHYGLPH